LTLRSCEADNFRLRHSIEPASHESLLGRRVSAALIDLALLFGLLVVLALAIGESEVEGGGVSLSLHGADAGLYFALVLLYYFGLEAALGQTIGKLLLGLRVVGPDGGLPSAFRVAVRTLLRIVDWLPLLYLVGFIAMMATGPRRRRLGDLVAGTGVARAQPVRRRSLALAPLAFLLLSIVGLSVYRAVDSGGGTANASRADGTQTIQAANGPIVFASERGCRDAKGEISEIFVMNADGSDQTNLTHTSAAELDPAWSPDGTRIAYTRSTSAEAPADIFVMNADGTGQRNLTKNPANDAGPSWSPDGKKIAFVRDKTDDDPFEIFVMNADGSDQRNLTKNSPGWNLYPDWSPDGARIAYARSTSADAETDISVMDADGSDQTNLTHTSIRESEPVWSPDGRKIAFTRAPTIYPPDAIFVMNADGSGQRNLTNNPEDDYSAPSWSPDGKKIAFESDRTNYPRKEIPPFDIFVMNADGSGKTNLTKSAENDWNGGWKALPASAPPPPPSAQQRPCR
jgi:Tol biopolymer transport system component/uncharacterized RDD family membrane protein YckC